MISYSEDIFLLTTNNLSHYYTFAVFIPHYVSVTLLLITLAQNMRAAVWGEYEKEHRALEHSGYQADPLEWLASSWQGAAIGSLISKRPCKY